MGDEPETRDGEEDWSEVMRAVKAGSQLGGARREQHEVQVAQPHELGRAVLGS